MRFIIALWSGIVVSFIGFLIYRSMRELRIKKRISKDFNIRTPKTKLFKYFSQMVLFIGAWLEKLHISYLERFAVRIKDYFSILGYPYATLNPYLFMGLQISAAICLAGVYGYIFCRLDISNIFKTAIVLTGVGLGLFGPYIFLKSKVKTKYDAIFREIPDFLDFLVLMIEAGLDFSHALNRIINIKKGSLIDELRLIEQEIRLGKSRADAFNDMAKRIHFFPLTNMINSMNLALRTGTNVVSTLRNLSAQFRIERGQESEKLAALAPVKLMLPLLVFIFPTIFIMIFCPIGFTLMDQFGLSIKDVLAYIL